MTAPGATDQPRPPAAAEQPLERARAALDLAPGDPAAARELAQQALADATATSDHAAMAVAWRALGLLALLAGEPRAAIDHLRTAAAVAEAHELNQLAGEARMTLAPALAEAGDHEAALVECDRAAALLTGLPLARLEAQRAGLLNIQGREDDALVAFERALPMLEAEGDRLWVARVRNNRGTLHLRRGEFAAARTDLEAAERLLSELGLHQALAHARHHLGMAAAVTGNVPEALAWFEQADDLEARLGNVDPKGLADRCTALLPARLTDEAIGAARRAVAALERGGSEHYLADARLVLAEAALAAGDAATADDAATEAGLAFADQGRPAHAARATWAALRARSSAGDRSRPLLVEARRAARLLAEAGWPTEAVDAHIFAGSLAAELGLARIARRELVAGTAVAAGSADGDADARHLPALRRARLWHARAMLHALDRETAQAEQALSAGLDVLDDYRTALGATELRATAGGYLAELSVVGLELALADADAGRALAWAERARAGGLLQPPVQPPDDIGLASHLAELRKLTLDIETATLDGDRDQQAALRNRQAELEDLVRRRARLGGASGSDPTASAADGNPAPIGPATSSGDLLASLERSLGPWALLELIEHDETLHAIVVVPGQPPTLQPLAAAADVSGELDALRFALRRLTLARATPSSLAAAAAAAYHSARLLDALLLDPVRSQIGGRPLAIVPTGSLHLLPWSMLPSCRGRAVTIAPSAGMWLRATQPQAAIADRVVLVAGPRLLGAVDEIDGLAERYPTAVCLTGRAATAERVAAALDGARLAHIACHGRFRSDNALFSSLELADGPLTVYDLERLARPPDVLVLSACDSGLSTVHPGDELLGLAASLFSMGTQSLVASLIPVPDEAARSLMLYLHTALQAGGTPAQSLAAAQTAALATGDHRALAAAASFICLGAG